MATLDNDTTASSLAVDTNLSMSSASTPSRALYSYRKTLSRDHPDFYHWPLRGYCKRGSCFLPHLVQSDTRRQLQDYEPLSLHVDDG